jgi:hypothetical protein
MDPGERHVISNYNAARRRLIKKVAALNAYIGRPGLSYRDRAEAVIERDFWAKKLNSMPELFPPL